MSKNPLYNASSISNDHYSPASIIEPARAVLEWIDLDPATCVFANALVRAKTIFINGQSTLTAPWYVGLAALPSRVFLNPPGGKYDKAGNPIKDGPGRSSAAVWWAKLVKEWRAGNVHSAIFVCFSLNVFRTAQSECDLAPYEMPFVVCGDRVRYDRNVGGVRVPGKAPNQDSAVVYLPPRLINGPAGDRYFAAGDKERFREHFSHLGAVRL